MRRHGDGAKLERQVGGKGVEPIVDRFGTNDSNSATIEISSPNLVLLSLTAARSIESYPDLALQWFVGIFTGSAMILITLSRSLLNAHRSRRSPKRLSKWTNIIRVL
jgi:hypothetical protein